MRSKLRTLPPIPWQVTGNHWLSLPCVHPADGSIHGIGLLWAGARGALEFAGGPDYEMGTAPPLLGISFELDGNAIELAGHRMTWQRVLDWLPTFSATVGDFVIRGTIFAPTGRAADFPGFVYALSVENKGHATVAGSFRADGLIGARQVRVRSATPLIDPHRIAADGDFVVVSGSDPAIPVALAVAGDAMLAAVSQPADGAGRFKLSREFTVEAGARAEFALYVAAGPERDGAVAMAARMRSRGWKALASDTRDALATLQQSTGSAVVDRMVNRHLAFAYFYSAGRAIDDAHWYLFRSRAPWSAHGLTLRDYDALMWILPAFQIADVALARELLLRVCELHGYAPGRGVNYIDGTPFDVAPCLAAVAAYPVAIDRYVAHTGDDRIVEDAPIAETLYAVNDELAQHRHPALPLYRTTTTPSGDDATLPFTLYGNALVADALDILRQTLDEKTAESVQSGDAVRAAVVRNFATDRDDSRTVLTAATDLAGTVAMRDDPVGSVYLIPLYHMLSRDDSIYRRTVRRTDPSVPASQYVHVAERCAWLLGPDAAGAIDWLRAATLDDGRAAEFADESGRAIGNGGDASLSALIAYFAWYATSVLGVIPG